MSRNLSMKTSTWIVIDETGSEGDDDCPSKERDAEYENEYRSIKKTVRKTDKDKDKVNVVNLDKSNRRVRTNDKDEATNSKTNATQNRRRGLNSKTDIRGEERSTKTDVTLLTRHEIIIDDKDHQDIKVEESVPVQNRKRKRIMETVATKKVKSTEKYLSKRKLAVDETGEHLDIDKKGHFDSVVEYQSSRKSGNKNKHEISVISSDRLNRKADTKERYVRENSSTAMEEVRKKGSNNRADVREEQRSSDTDFTLLTRNEITIDDEDSEDMKLEIDIPVKNTKRKVLDEIFSTKKAKTVRASSSIKKLEIAETVKSKSKKLNKDKREDSDTVIEYHSNKKTERKNKNKISVVDSDKSNHKATIKGKDLGANIGTALIEETKKELSSKIDVRKQERLSKTDTASLSRNEIIINDDDDEEIQLETSVPIKRTKKKEELAKVVAITGSKTTQVSSLKQNLAINKASDNIFVVDLASIELSEDESEYSDHIVEYQSSMKAERKEKDKISVSGSDKQNHKAGLKDKGVTKCRNIEVKKKRFNSQVDLSEEEGLSDTDTKLSSTNEITIDDEDDEDIELKTEVSAKNTKRKGLNETAATKKAKTVGASPSRKKLKINEEDKILSTVEPENNKPDKNKKDNFNSKVDVEWSESDYLTEFNQIEPQIAENLISLFKNDNTIPFIARYRKEMTGGMEPEQLRNIKNTYDNLKSIKQRALLILKTIDKSGKWSPEIHSAVTAAKTLDELELIYAPFKPGTKRSLAERAKELGLASISESILQGRAIPHLSSLIDERREGLRNENDVKQGIVHIIADVISKDKTTFEGIRMLRKTVVINIESTKSKAASSSKASTSGKHNNDHQKYENYFKFVSSERLIKDYQILAINRGESQKILSVKIIVPDWFERDLKVHCLQKYNFVRKISNFYYNILNESFHDAYTRLIKPLVARQVRHDLNERAERASIEVFARNLKKLLLIPPLRGKTVLGIDPGFRHGCKLAVISQCGNVLDTATIYPHTGARSDKEKHVQDLANLIKKHSCTIIALGNATACRETEMFLTDLIQAGVFAPLDVSYTIVNEAGASIYSCGSEAKSEFSNLDPNIISAISIARRLQDPLAELIKVEPQHLGIGMYQLDLPKKQLHLALDEAITETVSFVGVDINTASHCLLRRVAGLSVTRAMNIITHRNQCGPFSNRQEILEVKGIGKKFFVQCAGFIRILPETALTGNRLGSKKYPLDYLDQTWIHPESYDVARRFLKACQCDLSKLGTENFVQKVLSYANGNRKMLAEQFGTSEQSMDIIIKGLSMKKGEDIRVKEDAPLFQRNLRCIGDLRVNTELTGSVTNVTNFGAFVDIGVGQAGLIPIGKMKGKDLSLGQRVEVVVVSIDEDRGRISLSL